ncbi:MAG: helix-turn-helix domain-containing protein [Spirochaetes bacterium]|nr:helix-turn-helix domain-containing protein [Spirochaetota bacterium]
MTNKSAVQPVRPWPEWMRADVASEYCGLSESYLRGLASAEAIAATKPAPKILLFKRTDLDEYLTRTRKEAIV